MKRSALVFCFLSLFGSLYAQQGRPFSEQASFSEYLINNSEYRDAIYTLHKINTGLLSRPQLDSLNYLTGWSFYNIRVVDTSAIFLDKVSSASPFYHKSKFYQAFDIAYTGRYPEAGNLVQQIVFNDSVGTNELRKVANYELSALALLKRDYVAFDSLSKSFTYDYFPIAAEEKGFVEDAKKLRAFKDKSPFVAGLMSAVIPGSGKFYTGYKGQGAAALLTVSALAAVALESYIRGGYKSPQFIAFGSIFTIFYIGNIWGSALSVKIRKDAFYKQVDNDILLDMHIPLRRIFN